MSEDGRAKMDGDFMDGKLVLQIVDVILRERKYP